MVNLFSNWVFAIMFVVLLNPLVRSNDIAIFGLVYMVNYGLILSTALDAPPIESVLVEEPYPHGPYGAKGLGELPMDGPAPAVAAAILHAVGVLVPELPITPERLMAAVEGAR